MVPTEHPCGTQITPLRCPKCIPVVPTEHPCTRGLLLPPWCPPRRSHPAATLLGHLLLAVPSADGLCFLSLSEYPCLIILLQAHRLQVSKRHCVLSPGRERGFTVLISGWETGVGCSWWGMEGLAQQRPPGQRCDISLK